VKDNLPMKADFNPRLPPTFSFVFSRGKRGSTGSKQTSKGLFIFFLPTFPGSLGYASAFLVRHCEFER
jgi:hypothetical protein